MNLIRLSEHARQRRRERIGRVEDDARLLAWLWITGRPAEPADWPQFQNIPTPGYEYRVAVWGWEKYMLVMGFDPVQFVTVIRKVI